MSESWLSYIAHESLPKMISRSCCRLLMFLSFMMKLMSFSTIWFWCEFQPLLESRSRVRDSTRVALETQDRLSAREPWNESLPRCGEGDLPTRRSWDLASSC